MPTTYQKRVAALARFYRTKKRMPSFREMLGLFNVKSKNTVSAVVDDMITDGIVRKDNTGRLVPLSLVQGVRILGAVTAGFPSPAEEELEDAITLDEYMISNKQSTFMLRVSGDSMIQAGIHEGDLVLVERGRQGRNGDIVIAHVDEEFTLKRLVREGGKMVLRAENPRFRKPIEADETITIEGVVIGVVRKYG